MRSRGASAETAAQTLFPASRVSLSPSVHSDVVIPLVDVKAQYAPLIPELKERFARRPRVGPRSSSGPRSRRSSARRPRTSACAHAIGVANGTDALVLSLEAMGIGAGDEVICPSFTFYATAEAIARRGATPVFADIDPVTLNLDPADVAARDHAADEGDHAGAPLRPAGAARRARGARPAVARGRGAGLRRAGRREHGRLLDVQLLPDEEPLRARRRRARRRASTTSVAERVRMLRFHGSRDKQTFELVGDELAARRDPGRAAARLPAAPRGLERRPPRRRRPLRGARARRGSSSCRSTSRATSTTCTSSGRPSRDRHRRGAAARPGSRRAVVLRDAAAPAAGAALPRATSRARCPRPSARRPRTSPCRCGAASADVQEQVVAVLAGRSRARSVRRARRS